MKLLGVRMDALAGVRRRPGTSAPKLVVPEEGASPADSAAFLGLGVEDLTGPVQAALTTLLGEIDELRQEVGRLKARLTEAEGLADEDVLTPLLNRRAFVRELRRVLAFTQRYGGPASLVYFDLDGFKAVNDRFGHAAGDVALQTVARRLADNVRESDIAGRLGGDEFGVILVHADHDAALAKAAALAAIVQTEPIACGEWLMPIKISYGVGQILPDATAEQVLAEADAAMYARKRLTAAAGKLGTVRREAGEEERVEVPYGEGLAIRIGPEPCVVGREAGGEASAGVRIGQPLSRERFNQDADAIVPAEGETGVRAIASARPVLRGRRPWHVRTLLARKPGDLDLGRA